MHDCALALYRSLCVAQVACHGPGLDATAVTIILDVVRGYSACKALLVTDCLLGDQGLSYIASLLSQSCGKWWTGPKLTLLEITFERRPAKVSTGSQNRRGDALSSLLVVIS